MPVIPAEASRNRRTAKRILAIGLPFVLLAGTGIGYAFWTSSGNGSGTATASTGIPVVVDVGPVTGLAPGGSVSVPVKLSNPSQTDLQASTLSLTSITPDLTACTTTVSGLTTSVSTPVATLVSAGASAVSFGTVTVNMANSSLNQDACKGVVYTVAVHVG